jgi:endonuclease YncB( thermonuclease family)
MTVRNSKPAATLALLLGTLLAAVAHASTNAVVEGRCVGVHDGDTITVLTEAKEQVKVRLHGIDAPELGQAFGRNSKQALSDRVFGKEVRVAVVDTDRYGRTVGEVYAATNWVNKAMVEAGMAWHYTAYSKSEELATAERTAREKRLGLWTDREPVPPWEFRKGEKAK